MIQTKQFVLVLCTLLASTLTYSQTTLNLVNSYSISDDVNEPSGLAYDKLNNQLFSVSDTGDIYRLSTTGNLLDTYDLSGDLEGVSTYNTPNTLLVAIEDTYEIIEYNYVTGSSTSHTMDYDNQEDPGSGIEGVTYNNNTGEIYFLNEKDPGALIVANSNFNVTDEYELTYAGDYSASYYVEETNELWLGSDNSSTIYKCNTDGSVIETFEMSIDGDELDKLEGIAIDYDNQLLYVVTDGGGELLVYEINEETTEDSLSVSSLSAFNANGGSQTISVTANIDWTVSENSNWITINRTSGSDNGSVSVTTTENTSTDDRTATVTIAGSGITRTVTVSQDGAEDDNNNNFTSVPALIQAEDFDTQLGIRTENTEDNGGGENVGFIDTDDFLTYNINVPSSGAYTIDFRVASRDNGTEFDIFQGNTILSSVSSPATGAWQTWETVSVDVNLTAGDQTLRLLATGSDWNINWLDISTDDDTDNEISCTEGTNLSLNATIVDFSTEQNSTNTVQNIIDNSTNNRWSAQNFPQYATIDLGDEYSVNEISLATFENRDYQFIVDGSTTSATSGFSTLVDASDNTSNGTIVESFSAQTVRYVRLTITGANSYSGEWASITQFQVNCTGASNKNISTANAITISSFPNPFTSSITVANTSEAAAKLKLVSLQGNLITETPIKNNTTTLNNLEHLANGLYLVQLFNEDNQIISVQKVVKE